MTSHVTSAVQRYDLVEHGCHYSEGSIDPVDDGDYVLHSDYQLLLAKLAAVELSAREMEDAARSYRDRMNSALARLAGAHEECDRWIIKAAEFSDGKQAALEQRDSALTRAEQSEALLSKVLNTDHSPMCFTTKPDPACDKCEAIRQSFAHLTPKANP